MISDIVAGLEVECDRLILLIRHGEKVRPPEEEPFMDVGLTNRGASSSFHLGEKLRTLNIQDDFEIHSSPLKRCVETAKNIAQGMDSRNTPIVTSSVLGGPGPYVEDENLAGKTYTSIQSRNRNAEIIERLLKGDELPGFRDIDEGSQLLLQYLFHRCNKRICVAISHDTILLPLMWFLHDGMFKEEDWLDYLDGIVFCIKERKVTMHAEKISNFDISHKLKEMRIV